MAPSRRSVRRVFGLAGALALGAAVHAQSCTGLDVSNWTTSTTAAMGSRTVAMTGGINPFTPTSFCNMAAADFSGAPLAGSVNVWDYGQGSDWTATFSAPVSTLYLYLCVWRASTYTFDRPFTLLSGAASATISGTSITTQPTFTSGILVFQNVTTLTCTEPSTQGSKQQLTFAAPAQCSSESIRPGTPPNPVALLPGVSSGPVVGGVWDPFVDHTNFLPSALIDLLAVGVPWPDVPTAFGTVLVDLFGPLLFYAAPAAGAPFVVPLPPDPSLSGVALSSQAASIDGASVVRFTNALDIVIG